MNFRGWLLFFGVQAACAQDVTVRLQAGWSAAPLALEMIQSFASSATGLSAHFITWMLTSGLLSPVVQPATLYQSVIDQLAVDSILGDDANAPFFALSLALHSHAPAIEASFHYYRSLNRSKILDSQCGSWVDWQGQQWCSAAKFMAEIESDSKRAIRSEVHEELSFDHVYNPHGIHSLPVAVLYGDVFSQNFGAFHEALRSSANDKKLLYVLRLIPSESNVGVHSPLYLSGFGVELAIKSTEYQVIDDRKVDSPVEQDSGNDDEVSDDSSIEEELGALDETANVRSLTSEEIRGIFLRAKFMSPDVLYTDLGIKTAKYILDSASPLQHLQSISQDFPKYAHSIAKAKLNKGLQLAVRQNNAAIAMAGSNKLYVNGLDMDIESLDMFRLLRVLKREHALISALRSIGFSANDSMTFVNAPAPPVSNDLGWGEAFDVRSSSIVWWNDLEKDSRYKSWPKSIRDILRPAYPNQLKYLRKNMFNVLLAVDFMNLSHLNVMLEAFSFIEREIPLRFGVIPLLHTTEESEYSSLMARAFYAIVNNQGRKEAKAFLIKLHAVLTELRAKAKAVSLSALQIAFHSATHYDLMTAVRDSKIPLFVQEVHEFASRLGLSAKEGAVFLNGKYIPLDENWQQNMLVGYGSMVEYLQGKVYVGIVNDKTNIHDFFLNQPNVYKTRNPFIFASDAHPLRFMSQRSILSKGFQSLKYFTKATEPFISLVIVADFNTPSGLKTLDHARRFLESTTTTRVAFLHNPSEHVAVSNSIVRDLLALSMTDREADLDEFLNLLFESTAEIIDVKTAPVALTKEDLLLLATHCSLATMTVGIDAGSTAIIVNGRIVGPMSADIVISAFDLELVATIEHEQRIKNLVQLVKNVVQDPEYLAPRLDFLPSAINIVSALVNSHLFSLSEEDRKAGKQTASRLDMHRMIRRLDSNDLAFDARNSSDGTTLVILAVIDPISNAAQKLSSILNTVSKIPNVAVRILLNPVLSITELPVKRFYRYLISHEPSFDDTGRENLPTVKFSSLPAELLLTLGMDVPQAWLTTPVFCPQDLDNLKLSSEPQKKSVDAVFKLRNILVEGHVTQVQGNQPPRGVQFILGTSASQHIVDTITMANLGYIQLKANPGAWELRLRDGRSAELFTLEGVTSISQAPTRLLDADVGRVVVDSFEGCTIFPRLSKRPGKENEDVLTVPEPSEKDSGLWDKLRSSLFGKGALQDSGQNITINVFSVASGHLYERFLGIMMLSVVRQTSSPVKFWLIENFLSPSFMEFLPALAAEYQFDFEFVTYKWPHWLRGQSEKQRTIWGYKILFLDVLFPLSLDKVIFVDADQVVRTDLKELVNMDLKGAVYGYTPFCDSRAEMEGFRFWKSGYWKSHLAGRPYHISALYVIDLVRFRQLYAGDRLRQQYQMLSADPGSLANLDQDLPNNMIHQIPIFSLPQEWLWCETWCSDKELETAKTIDLCNNPLTKEPKLERARRILPEWDGLDKEVAVVAKRHKRSSLGVGREKVRDEL